MKQPTKQPTPMTMTTPEMIQHLELCLEAEGLTLEYLPYDIRRFIVQFFLKELRNTRRQTTRVPELPELPKPNDKTVTPFSDYEKALATLNLALVEFRAAALLSLGKKVREIRNYISKKNQFTTVTFFKP